MNKIQAPWIKTGEEVLHDAGGSPRGLTAETAKQRLAEFGLNTLAARRFIVSTILKLSGTSPCGNIFQLQQ